MPLENFGQYQLVKKLAAGGMAQIYLARQKGVEGFEKLVVVKRILPHLGENEDFVKMFLDEARNSARLNHSNIVQIFDLGQAEGSFYIAMEYIHGEDLRRVWKRSEAQGTPLPVPLVCRILIEACSGLDYAHKKTDPSGKPLGIVHRDVSPQNILVTFDGGVKVVDFGIAKAADQATVTRSGVLKGKYSYMSPEQSAGKKVDRRTDIFALGVVLYELLTSTRLFKRATDIQTLNAVADCIVIPPSQVNPRVPADLDRVVMKALAKNAEDRYQNAVDLQLALEDWLISHQLASSSAHLSLFMRELYADRLAKEERAGQNYVDDGEPASGKSPEGAGAKTPGTRPRKDPEPRADVATGPRPERTGPTRSLASRKSSEPSSARRTRDDHPAAEPSRRSRVPEPSAAAPRAPRAPIDERSMSFATEVSEVGSGSRRKLFALVGAVALLGLVAVGYALRSGASDAGGTTGAPGPRRAQVRVITQPEGATATFAGRRLDARTPLTLPETAAGQYPLELDLDGFAPVRLTVTVPASGEKTLPVVVFQPREGSAPATVRVAVQTEPAGAKVSVDGEERGRAPFELEAPPGATLHLAVSAAGYQLAERDVHVGEGPEQRERIALDRVRPVVERELRKPPPPDLKDVKPATGTVRFLVVPITAWATVACDGRKLGDTPMQDQKLAAGSYECTFTNPDLGTKTQRVEVRANTVSKVTVKF